MLLALATLAVLCGQPTVPRRVAPGPSTAVPPGDAARLFEPPSLEGWTTRDGKPAGWTAYSGVVTVKARSGDIVSRETFGDSQIHVEFRTPIEEGNGQDRGNSGVYIQGRYEVQILDSHGGATYPDGQCGAIYKQHAPLVNACRPQGEWQTYDIIFRAPRFDDSGRKIASARLTVFHNGVLIHDHAEIMGPTGGATGQSEAPTGPILLQDHGHAVEFRNLWVRAL
jgi:hypothetical protein